MQDFVMYFILSDSYLYYTLRLCVHDIMHNMLYHPEDGKTLAKIKESKREGEERLKACTVDFLNSKSQ